MSRPLALADPVPFTVAILMTTSLMEATAAMDTADEITLDDVLIEAIVLANDPPIFFKSLEVEPANGRWLYGIDHNKGDLIRIDLEGRQNGETRARVIRVKGLARSVRILQLQETDEPGPYTFNGTFAVVVTTVGRLYVIDLEDLDQDWAYFKPHRVRSRIDLSLEDEQPQVQKPKLSINLSFNG